MGVERCDYSSNDEFHHAQQQEYDEYVKEQQMQEFIAGCAEDDYRKELINNILNDRLEEICTAEKEGRCVVLPWKVGDTVYEPYPDGIDQAGVDKIIIEISTKIGIYEISDVGKTVFLTKEQAETKLAEMKGGERDG